MLNRDIIVVGLQPWDIEIGSNCKNIALEFSKNNRVLYVNRSLDRISNYRQRNDKKIQARRASLKGTTKDIKEEKENLWVLNPRVILESVNWMPRPFFRYFNKRNNIRIANAINDAVVRLRFFKPVLFIDNDFFRALYLPELVSSEFSIYYIRDYLVDQPYFKKHGATMEKEIISKVNMVTANSPYLADYARKFNPNSFYIGQGCDFSNFHPGIQYNIPADLKELQGPIIGYVGALVGFRLNIPLLIDIAKKRPDWNIVLVGPQDSTFQLSELHQLPNVLFTGAKPPEDLPNYINYFDVCINPQLVNQATLGNYPRKIDEYLAMGKPVVATHTPFMELFKSYVYLCNNSNEFVLAIEKALQEENSQIPEERKKFAFSHTWENSVEEIYKGYELLTGQ